jgi:hypothetical protein
MPWCRNFVDCLPWLLTVKSSILFFFPISCVTDAFCLDSRYCLLSSSFQPVSKGKLIVLCDGLRISCILYHEYLYLYHVLSFFHFYLVQLLLCLSIITFFDYHLLLIQFPSSSLVVVASKTLVVKVQRFFTGNSAVIILGQGSTFFNW